MDGARLPHSDHRVRRPNGSRGSDLGEAAAGTGPESSGSCAEGAAPYTPSGQERQHAFRKAPESRESAREKRQSLWGITYLGVVDVCTVCERDVVNGMLEWYDVDRCQW